MREDHEDGHLEPPWPITKTKRSTFRKSLLTIPTATITRTNELVFTAATEILEMLGYTIKKKSSSHAHWKMRLEVKEKSSPGGADTERCGDKG